MKDTKQAIDKVLAGLRDVQTPSGMEQRVLAAMEERAAVRVGWRWRRWSFGLAAVMLVALGVVALRPHRVKEDVVAGAKPGFPMPTSVVTRDPRNTGVLHSVQNDVKSRRTRTVVAAASGPEEVGGIPAPPMPLTEQERMLLRLAHRNDATELTPLIAEARAKRYEEFDAEFQEFFAVPIFAIDYTDSIEDDKGETR